MATKTVARFETMQDLLESLGGISPERVRLTSTPATATVRDVIRLLDRHKRVFTSRDDVTT